MTSVIGQSVLQEFRKLKGFEEAIIAGGFCRDSILGGPVKDVDVFVPALNFSDFEHKIIDNLDEDPNKSEIYQDNLTFEEMEKLWKSIPGSYLHYEVVHDIKTDTYKIQRYSNRNSIKWNIKNFKNLVFTEKSSYQRSNLYLGKFDCKYMDFLDVDIVGYYYNPKCGVSFSDCVINVFNFGIDRIYYNGEETVKSEEFQRDEKYVEATLCYLPHISELPGVMRKFERLREKYPLIKFRTSCLDIVNKEKK